MKCETANLQAGNVIRDNNGNRGGFIHDWAIHDNGGRIVGFVR